jgi:alpha-galactosidase
MSRPILTATAGLLLAGSLAAGAAAHAQALAPDARGAGDRGAVANADVARGTAVDGKGLRLEFDAAMRSRVVAKVDGEAGETPIGPFGESEYLLVPGGRRGGFLLRERHDEAFEDGLGAGHRTILTGRAGALEKRLEVVAYDAWQGWLFMRVTYTNGGKRPLRISGYRNHDYRFSAATHGAATQGAATAGAAEPGFWSYQPGSYEPRPDWVMPVGAGYRRGNFLGMNASDYGGGTPVLDVWRRDVGLAIGHVELVPKLASLPVRRQGRGPVEVALEVGKPMVLAPGASVASLRSFVAVHHGDYFATLRQYAAIMRAQGLQVPAAPADAFEPIWCAWGYGQSFTPDQVFESLPVVKQLGFRWATLDDGWQVALGDWTPNPAKFPGGDADMKAMVARIHAAGLKAQLWWAPLAVVPTSRTQREHPDWLLRNADGTARTISYWNASYLCPAYGPVGVDAQAFVRKALGEWGFDGLKIDGQHLNASPACSNPAHHHAQPEDAFEQTPAFFKGIWEAAQAVRPGAVVEICPCGTGYSFFTMPYLNMAVASDPESSWQVRTKGKTLKALLGDRTAYFGDHVELSDGGTDFASTFGVGGVIGTNFAWRDAPGKLDPKVVLTPERQQAWARWTALYDRIRLVDGNYDGTLYDIGFDRPEAHVVRKGDSLYYAFYAPSFDGALELRGLQARAYHVRDYANDRDLGLVQGPIAHLGVAFSQSLLLEVRPVASSDASHPESP